VHEIKRTELCFSNIYYLIVELYIVLHFASNEGIEAETGLRDYTGQCAFFRVNFTAISVITFLFWNMFKNASYVLC
jgi:hypothetical protein